MIGIKQLGIAVLCVVGLILVALSWTTVPAGHRGVLTHWGEVQDEVLGEGLHFIAPVKGKAIMLSARVHKSEFKTTAPSKDMQDVNTTIAVQWRINPAKANGIYQEVGGLEGVINTVMKPAVEETFKAATAKFSANEILKARQEIKVSVDKAFKEWVGPYDVMIDNIALVEIGFSTEYTKAIEDKQVAEQEAEKAGYLVQKAEAVRKANVTEAKGLAEAQQLQSRTITPNFLKKLELENQKAAIAKWDGVLPKMNTGGGGMLLNLDAGQVMGK
jgi:regulator of protease activity HflC (stomatin/prohibitin superfamily)